MSTSDNKYDFIDTLIFEEGLKIKSLEFFPIKDQMFIYLSNGQLIRSKISTFERLKNASGKQLSKFQLNKSRTGIRWNEFDEDLSLRGFLKEYLKQLVRRQKPLIIS